VAYLTPETGQEQEVTCNPYAHPEFDSNDLPQVTQLTDVDFYNLKFIAYQFQSWLNSRQAKRPIQKISIQPCL
jgi:hypothetical protein